MVALLRVQLPAAFCLPYLSLTPDFFSCSYFGRLRVKNWNWNWNLTQLVSRFVYLLCSKARLFLCLARTLPCSFLPVLSHPLSPSPARFIFLSTSLDLSLPNRSLSFNVFVAPVHILSVFHCSFTCLISTAFRKSRTAFPNPIPSPPTLSFCLSPNSLSLCLPPLPPLRLLWFFPSISARITPRSFYY